MNTFILGITFCAVLYLTNGDSCFAKHKAMGTCIAKLHNTSSDWKNLHDKRKQIATTCVTKNKSWQKCLNNWEEMKTCWLQTKTDPNVMAAETYLATVFDSCVAESPQSPFAALMPCLKRKHGGGREQHSHGGHKGGRHHWGGEEGSQGSKSDEKERREKSKSSESKSKSNSKSDERGGISRENSNDTTEQRMEKKPQNDEEMMQHFAMAKNPFHPDSGVEQSENLNVFDRVKRMVEGPHEGRFDPEEEEYEGRHHHQRHHRKHHKKHHKKSPCMEFLKCVWEGEKDLAKTDKTLLPSADAVTQAKMKCKTDHYPGFACMPSHRRFEHCVMGPMHALEMEVERSMRSCLKVSEDLENEEQEQKNSTSKFSTVFSLLF